jgi:hypothetical protein
MASSAHVTGSSSSSPPTKQPGITRGGLAKSGKPMPKEPASALPPVIAVDGDGAEVEPVTAYLRDLAPSDMSRLTCRSYAFGLLRWFRVLLLCTKTRRWAGRFRCSRSRPLAFTPRGMSVPPDDHTTSCKADFRASDAAHNRPPCLWLLRGRPGRRFQPRAFRVAVAAPGHARARPGSNDLWPGWDSPADQLNVANMPGS